MKKLRNTMEWKMEHEDFKDFLYYVGAITSDENYLERLDSAYHACDLLSKVAIFYDQETYERFLQKYWVTANIKNKLLRCVYTFTITTIFESIVCRNIRDTRIWCVNYLEDL